MATKTVEQAPGTITAAEAFTVVGASVPRGDGLPKAVGHTAFTADLSFDNQLYGACLLAAVPCGRLRRIDTRPAEALDGVVAVMLARDLPGAKTFGTVFPDQPVISEGRVYCAVDVVALVAAESRQTAERALKLIEVEYEELPGVFSPVDAIAEGAPLAFPGHPKAVKGNLLSHTKIRKGNVDEGFARADVLVEGTYGTQFVDHAYLEPDVGIAVPHADGSITLYAPTQAPFILRRIVAPVLNLPLNKIRVVAMPVGGGFGGKEESAIDILVRAGVLALRTRRPVRMEYSRPESMIARGKRVPTVIRRKLGAARDGRIVAAAIEVFLDKGPYITLGGVQPPPFGGIQMKMLIHASGPYEIPHVKVDVYNVLTNNPASSMMRGLGVPQVHFACEVQMDELAAALKMDPVALRLRNAFEVGSKTATGQVLEDSVGVKECIERAAKAAEWGRPLPMPGSGRVRGLGMAASFYCTGTAQPSDAAGGNVYVTEDGTVQVGVGIVEMGQGSHTVLAQIVAEELGVRYQDVAITEVDTANVPDAGFTAGSRSTFVPGNALMRAARQVREQLLQVAAGVLDSPPDRLRAKDGMIFVADDPEKSLPFKEVALLAWRQGRPLCGQGWWAMPAKVFDWETGQGVPWPAYSFGVQVAEVEVDTATGQITVPRVVAAHDVGRAINPVAVEGQIEGGVAMGVGMAISEESVVERGVVKNPNFTTYIIPTSLDAPREITSIIVEHPTAHGPYGAKGVGESALIPPAPAVATAVAAAVGAPFRDLPITPEKVLRALAGEVR
jgi:CO/xanthine dehydrogenase Mo-binding subunit